MKVLLIADNQNKYMHYASSAAGWHVCAVPQH